MGYYGLKQKSIVRKELINDFLKINKINLKETSLAKQFVELFSVLSKDPINSTKILEDYIKIENQKQLKNIDVNKLVAELYKLENFKWGGDYQNSLDKYLVSRYVKVENPSYEKLISKFDSEIAIAVQGYVLSSWYNHWSSILIEHIFKSHHSVLPAVGKIKSVDFFIGNIPFDLKVTYLPVEYIKEKRKCKYISEAYDFILKVATENNIKFTKNSVKEKELKNIVKSFKVIKGNQILKETLGKTKVILSYCNEITYLKIKAKEASIPFDKKAKDAELFYSITKQMKDRKDDFCNSILDTIKNDKLNILKEVQNNPKMLATWLYENQGEMRFGSENRLFLVLVNTDDFLGSWELKRDFSQLKPSIISYLDNFNSKKIDDLKVSFNFKGKPQTFTALTDIIFVVK